MHPKAAGGFRPHHFFVIYDHDDNGILYGRQAVGNNQVGAFFHQPDQCVLNDLTCSGVYRGGHLV